MEVIKTAIDGVLIIEPKVFGDKRGYFFFDRTKVTEDSQMKIEF